jgi:pre-mRNA-splicing factor SYF2
MPAARTSKKGKKAAPKKKVVVEVVEEEDVGVEEGGEGGEASASVEQEASVEQDAPPMNVDDTPPPPPPPANSNPNSKAVLQDEDAAMPPPPAPNDAEPQPAAAAPTLTLEERKAKMDQLRLKRLASSKANRASLVAEAARAQLSARDSARLEKQRKLAEALREKADAEERGDPGAVERAKNWEWTVEENDAWEKKKARKERRADFAFHGASALH